MFKKEIILPATQARNNFFKILKELNKTYIITLGGKAKAVILSAQEYEDWRETIEIMSDPTLVKDIEKAEEDFKNHEYVTLEKVLAEEGFLVAESPVKKYAPNPPKKKGKKRIK